MRQLFTILFILLTLATFACECEAVRGFLPSIDRYAVIVEGEITGREMTDDGTITTVQVSEWVHNGLKVQRTSTVKVLAVEECEGSPVAEGRVLLLLRQHESHKHHWSMPTCEAGLVRIDSLKATGSFIAPTSGVGGMIEHSVDYDWLRKAIDYLVDNSDHFGLYQAMPLSFEQPILPDSSVWETPALYTAGGDGPFGETMIVERSPDGLDLTMQGGSRYPWSNQAGTYTFAQIGPQQWRFRGLSVIHSENKLVFSEFTPLMPGVWERFGVYWFLVKQEGYKHYTFRRVDLRPEVLTDELVKYRNELPENAYKRESVIDAILTDEDEAAPGLLYYGPRHILLLRSNTKGWFAPQKRY